MKQGTQPGTQSRLTAPRSLPAGLCGHVTLTTLLGVVFKVFPRGGWRTQPNAIGDGAVL